MRLSFRTLGLAAAVAASSVSLSAPGASPTAPQSCDEPTRRIFLYAVQLPPAPNGDIRLGWGLTPETASIPGPVIEMLEGECLAITVTNLIPAQTLAALRDRYGGPPDHPLGVSLHVHGVKYTTASDGTIHTGSWVPPGGVRTYKWFAAPKLVVRGRVVSQGTAGYWWYHDHVVGTDHGTGGIEHGLFGAVIVRRPGDLRPDRTFTVVMGPNATINLRHYQEDPQALTWVARQGERVEFVVIGVGSEFHTFHLHGHSWAANRTGELEGPADETPIIDTRTVGPADSFGFQVIAGEAVGPGAWMLHCHVQAHSDQGMVGFFQVTPGSAIPLQPQIVQMHHHPAT